MFMYCTIIRYWKQLLFLSKGKVSKTNKHVIFLELIA